ncbi:hypothetical protein [Streptomyces atratus]|uniref:hypothetical protein n=1 Tax=Streptomyces atratus TaxID=1893 RepID=UPI00225B1CFB|nr:hypothetical protein [Streptomyces atratus]MCX5346111.1 hypothetical protein [Streptomyces atratus]
MGELCEEPSLGQVREALSIPVERLLVARNDPSFWKRADDERQALIAGLDRAHRDIRVVDSARPMTEQEAWSCRLTDHSPLRMDPMYEGILEPLFDVCEGTPLEIGWLLRNSGNRGEL